MCREVPRSWGAVCAQPCLPQRGGGGLGGRGLGRPAAERAAPEPEARPPKRRARGGHRRGERAPGLRGEPAAQRARQPGQESPQGGGPRSLKALIGLVSLAKSPVKGGVLGA
eukprot:1187616-Prorocentrum_minimum.AAC.3